MRFHVKRQDTFDSNPAVAVISLSKWMEHVGITACTAWRWRKKGWLKTINIAGRQYLTQEAIDEFHRRAVSGEFAQVHKVPPHTSPPGAAGTEGSG